MATDNRQRPRAVEQPRPPASLAWTERNRPAATLTPAHPSFCPPPTITAKPTVVQHEATTRSRARLDGARDAAMCRSAVGRRVLRWAS